jgi:hypothetical protein
MWLANTICAMSLGMLVNFTDLNAIGSKHDMDKEDRAFQHHEDFQH